MGLFGKPFRNIKKQQLINTINDKGLEVEIKFSIGSTNYLVRRGMKPHCFEIFKNGNLIDQPGSVRDYQLYLETQILKLNYKSFTQIVILGNASFTPFMQLSTRDRREVIEDLLDIQIFSTMNMLLRDRNSDNKRSLTDINYNIDLTNDKIDVQQQYLLKLQSNIQKQVKDLKENIEDYKGRVVDSKSLQSSLSDEVDTLLASISTKDKTTAKFQKINFLLEKLKDKSLKAEKRADFYDNNDNCPTCEQVIALEVKAEKIQKTQHIIDTTSDAIGKLTTEQVDLNDELNRVNQVQIAVQNNQNKLRDCSTEIDMFVRTIKEQEKKIERIGTDNTNDTVSDNTLSELNGDMKLLEANKKKLVERREVYEVAAAMLKDGGIKSKIIKQYVPIMNKLVNKYLASLDFFVNFELDEEFNEIIKSRHRDEFSYASFSEGEKTRIDIALLLTWRAIAKLKNSTNTNLLILDEVFDNSLDLTGTDELTKLLNDMSDTNVFIITHTKGDVLVDKFRSQIRFEKVKSFSRIAP